MKKITNPKIEELVLACLKKKSFEQALGIVMFEEIRLETGRPPDKIVITPKYMNDLQILEKIFSFTPSQKECLTESQLLEYKCVAGMMFLLKQRKGNKWFNEIHNGDHPARSPLILRQFLNAGFRSSALNRYGSNSDIVIGVEILGVDDACEECKKIARKQYKLADAPDLPYEHCTNENGCRCCYAPLVAGEKYSFN